jgi:uncharacterized protein
MKKFGVVARILVVIGALNWGLVGLFHLDVVATLVGRHYGETSPLSSAIYILVALAGLYEAVSDNRSAAFARELLASARIDLKPSN